MNTQEKFLFGHFGQRVTGVDDITFRVPALSLEVWWVKAWAGWLVWLQCLAVPVIGTSAVSCKRVLFYRASHSLLQLITIMMTSPRVICFVPYPGRGYFRRAHFVLVLIIHFDTAFRLTVTHQVTVGWACACWKCASRFQNGFCEKKIVWLLMTNQQMCQIDVLTNCRQGNEPLDDHTRKWFEAGCFLDENVKGNRNRDRHTDGTNVAL